jgi:hypothetical protein
VNVAFPDTSGHMGDCDKDMAYTEIILIAGATLRTVLSCCGMLVETSRGNERARTCRANTDAV